MAITFTKLPIGSLDPKAGTVSGVAGKEVINIGVPIEQLHTEVIPLAQKGVPIEKVIKAVAKDPRITDKTKAAKIIEAVYQIMASKQTKNKV